MLLCCFDGLGRAAHRVPGPRISTGLADENPGHRTFPAGHPDASSSESTPSAAGMTTRSMPAKAGTTAAQIKMRVVESGKG